ncbi:MAG: hypothetical protein AAF556_10580 [Pseudomonadota bacterium]
MPDSNMTDPRAAKTKDLGTLVLTKPHDGHATAVFHDGDAPAFPGHCERLVVGVGQGRDGSLSVTSVEQQGMSYTHGLIVAVHYAQSFSMDPGMVQGPAGKLDKGQMFGVEFTAGGPLTGEVVSTFDYDKGDVITALEGAEAVISAKAGRATKSKGALVIGGSGQRFAAGVTVDAFNDMTDTMAETHAAIKAAADLPMAEQRGDIEVIKGRWARLHKTSATVGMNEANPQRSEHPLETPHRQAVSAKLEEWTEFRGDLKRAGLITDEPSVTAQATTTTTATVDRRR